jgi:hypothetical protein
MKIRAVSSIEEIFNFGFNFNFHFNFHLNERAVHLAFRPSNKGNFGLIELCPKFVAV